MATTVPVKTAPNVVRTQPIQQHLSSVNVRLVKGLAATQLCIGIISVIIGSVAVASQREHGRISLDYSGAGLWAGGWMYLTGSIGLCCSKNGRNLNSAYMTFSIISTCTSLVAGLLTGFSVFHFAAANVCPGFDDEHDNYVWDCSYRRQGVGLLILMVIEFIVSIVAAAMCCMNNGCACCGCCAQPGVVIQQQPYMPVAYTSVQYATQIPPQYSAQLLPRHGAEVQQASQIQMQQSSQRYIQSGLMQPQVMALSQPRQETNTTHLEKPPKYDVRN